MAPRAINLVYKVSKPKMLNRLQVFWENIIRVRALWQLLHPGLELKFFSADQKPFWFNNLANVKSYSIRGIPRVECKENHAQTRERFTAMTCSCSWVSEDSQPPPLAVLFKGQGARSTMESSEHTLAQWAEKGVSPCGTGVKVLAVGFAPGIQSS